MTQDTQAKKPDFLRFWINFLCIAASSILFALAFPNFLIENGFAPALWVAYIPIFWVIKREKTALCLLWGLIYGAASTILLNYWLFNFDKIAGVFVLTVYGIYFAVFFLFLKFAGLLLGNAAPLAQTAFWVGFEYLRTLGFLGYAYGITGYSQWTLLPLIKVADIFGVWFISALLIFPQALVGGCRYGQFARIYNLNPLKSPVARGLGIWLIVLVLVLCYGFASKVDYSKAKFIKTALLQPNSNPWQSGLSEYRNEFDDLKLLSDLALSEVPPPDLVVWPETAFVPSFYFHTKYRPNPGYYALVKDAQDYIASKKVPFVVGNDESRYVPDPSGDETIAHYNAVLLFYGDKVLDRYYKIRLVPFAEYFPYEKEFPKLYQIISNIVTLWTPGTRPVVFDVNGFKFSTPVCFEDSFDYLNREFTNDGAQFIVNLTNDSWSNCLAEQKVHLAMSVFRAVENRRAVIRSTVSGETCAIDPNGKILDLAPPFTKTVVRAKIPLMNSKTIYTRIGNVFPVACLIFAPLSFLVGLAGLIFKARERGTE